jgi:hypothetical protein
MKKQLRWTFQFDDGEFDTACWLTRKQAVEHDKLMNQGQRFPSEGKIVCVVISLAKSGKPKSRK